MDNIVAVTASNLASWQLPSNYILISWKPKV